MENAKRDCINTINQAVVLENVLEELKYAMDLARPDFLSEESLATEDELRSILYNNSSLDPKTVEMTCEGEINMFCYRGWIFKYKDRGYILYDQGNNNYKYVCKVEEVLTHLVLDDTFFETDSIYDEYGSLNAWHNYEGFKDLNL